MKSKDLEKDDEIGELRTELKNTLLEVNLKNLALKENEDDNIKNLEKYNTLVEKENKLRTELNDIKALSKSIQMDNNELRKKSTLLESNIEEVKYNENRFRILNAYYGTELNKIEVTSIIKNSVLIKEKNEINSNLFNYHANNSLLRTLEITYSALGNVLTLICADGDVLVKEENHLKTITTDNSLNQKNKVQGLVQFLELFNGYWNSVRIINNREVVEQIYVDQHGRYYVNNVFSFLIETNYVRMQDGIEFIKYDLTGKEYSREIMTIVDAVTIDSIQGSFNITYDKVKNEFAKIAVNISIKERQKLLELLEKATSTQYFSKKLINMFHNNSKKKNYFTLQILNGDEKIFNELIIFLNENNFDFSDIAPFDI